jgi:hypothetical protein
MLEKFIGHHWYEKWITENTVIWFGTLRYFTIEFTIRTTELSTKLGYISIGIWYCK